MSATARRRPSATVSASASGSPASLGNGALPALTSVDHPRVDVAAHDLMAGERDPRGQRQADLAKCYNNGPHADALPVSATVSPDSRARQHRLGDRHGLQTLPRG